jgi:predicted ATP-dependent endonuclease of OLD family
LTSDTAEMFFADRVILVEGPSESILLPRVAKQVCAASGRSCDPDLNNVSFINVGGKENFKLFTGLLDCIGVEWRIVADRDALEGTTLAIYKKMANIEDDAVPEERIRRLLPVGVVVLSNGEIEDYYPSSAIGAIAKCSDSAVQQAMADRRMEFTDPTARQLVEAVISDHQASICKAEQQRLPKLVPAWYSQSLQRLRDSGAIEQTERKTGDLLARWLKLTKPQIAQRIAQWIEQDGTRIPNRIARLIEWLILGRLPELAPPAAEGDTASPPVMPLPPTQ